MWMRRYAQQQTAAAAPSAVGPKPMRRSAGPELLDLQRSHGNQAVQAHLRRRAHRGHDELGGKQAAAGVEAVLRQRRGRGEALPAATAERLSAGFGADLADVRVHTGPEAAAVAGQLRATAFSYGTDLYFETGAYRPHTASGQALLAHEIAHTLQPGPTAGPPTVGRAADPAERAADISARRALGSAGPARGSAAAPHPTSQVIRRVLTKSSDAKFGPVDPGSGQGTWAEVTQLGADHDEGSETGAPDDFRPYAYTQLFQTATTRNRKGVTFKYVQGHLLNSELGGPGRPDKTNGADADKNLTAFPANPTNADHKYAIENRMKEEIDKGEWYHYKVSAKYGKDSVDKLIRRLGITEEEFDDEWEDKTGISSSDDEFSYAEKLTATAQKLDESATDFSGKKKAGEKEQVVTMSIPSPLSFIRTDAKRKNEFPDVKDSDTAKHRNYFKDAQDWSNVDYPMDWTQNAMNPKPALGATSTAASGRVILSPMRWRGFEAARKGTIDPNQTNPAYLAGIASYNKGVKHAQVGKDVATVEKTGVGNKKIEYPRTGKGYTAGRADYSVGVDEAAAHPWSASVTPTTTLTGGSKKGFDDYMAGVAKAKNGDAPSASSLGEQDGHDDFMSGKTKKPAPTPTTYGYEAGKAAA